jgi:hypothetical protein
MRISRMLALICIAVLGMATAASAACARFTASDVNVTYDPLGTQGVTQVIQPLSLTVARGAVSDPADTATGVIAQFVDHDSITTLRIGSRGPLYAIQGSQPVLVDRVSPQLGPTQIFTHVFTGSGTGLSEPVSNLQFIIDPGHDLPAGVYDESIDMQFRCTTASATPGTVNLQSSVLHVSVNVPSKLTASLSGGSTSGTLDFADFSTLSKTAMVNVYSTGPFALTIVSANGGAMKLDGAPIKAANAAIDYTVNFAGVPVAVGNETHFDRTGIGGTGLPLQVTVGSPDAKRAGIYRDSLTLTFVPLATL